MSEILSATVQTVSTPDGALTLIADEEGRVLASGWTDDAHSLALRIHPSLRPAELIEGETSAAAAVAAFYAGETRAIMGVPVRQQGTEFQNRGWAALRTIAPGEPLTYTEFAALLGKPSAVRAAAAICARNAPALFVPCHRVLRTDGSYGGFAWGTAVKGSLLDYESRLRQGAAGAL